MSKVRTGLIVSLLSVLSHATYAQTIDELTEAARRVKLQALQASSSGMPASGQGGYGTAPAPIPPVVPLPASDTPAQRRASMEPYLLAIYGIGTRLTTEIAEDGAAARYRAGDVTQGGWTVASIAKREVVLKKTKKRGKEITTKKLSFWRELVDPANDDTPHAAKPTGPGSFTPPMPVPPGRF